MPVEGTNAHAVCRSRIYAWPVFRTRANESRQGRGRRDAPGFQRKEQAIQWLQDTTALTRLSGTDATQGFLRILASLRRLNTADEVEVQTWCAIGGLTSLCELESCLKQNAIELFEIAKFELAKARDKNLLRADLLRPCFASVTCGDVWELQRNGDAASVLASLSGCSETTASSLLRFGTQLSELFAPVEFAKRVGRQDWTRNPCALGAAMLPALDAAVRAARERGREPAVAIFGGFVSAALVARLGCRAIIVEPRRMLRECLRVVLDSNGLGLVELAEEAEVCDILVLEGLEEDGLFEFGHLRRLRSHLQKCQRSSLMPAVVPPSLRVWAALVDESLPRIRGCRLSRFDRMRGFDLQVSHRWPRGACHIQPQLRSRHQQIFELNVSGQSDMEEAHVSFVPEPNMPLTGVAYWIEWPDGPPVSNLADSWMCCIQPLPVRRASASAPAAHIRACLSDIKLWFQWSDESNEPNTMVPPLGKTKLPPWHFKMLNDHERNRRYDLAISRAVARAKARSHRSSSPSDPSDPSVPLLLDCGCGAGLLSLLAQRSGAGVTAVELSAPISDITRETFEDACHESFSPKPPFQLITGDARSLRDRRHDVIVSELMDASGVGESLLSVLEHACKHLALPAAQVIPCSIRLIGGLGWVTLPSCHGFGFSALESLYFCSRQGGPFSGEVSDVCLRGGEGVPSLHTGPFTSRNLNRLRRGEVWDLLTGEHPFLAVHISKALRGESLYPCANEVELVVLRDGVINSILWWWEVQLDEHETLSNRPKALGGYATHWHQPLLPLGPVPVVAGQRLRLKVSISDAAGQKLSFTLEPVPGAWSVPRLPADPLTDLLATWRTAMDEACAENSALTAKFTSRGDLAGLATLQQAVLVLCLMPHAFGCDPFIRDRLLSSYFGVAYK
ncbi:unnamed protein product [Effrenium voratum]|uniref:Protein arginine N-methyltransferase 7 n=1 Tax=Effrenium voratum TaxID=2562239 RepID=A0AA36HYE4_9DINO|nr:unnamed protein product [Effrenium voratum]